MQTTPTPTPTPPARLHLATTTNTPLPDHHAHTVGEAGWVADLVDTFRAGGPEVVADQLEELAATIRGAEKAGQVLVGLEEGLLGEGLALARARRQTP